MTSYFDRVMESKRLHRARVVLRSVAEKLRTLDTLRQREVAIRAKLPTAMLAREDPVQFQTKPE